jgi:hypothetical protein
VEALWKKAEILSLPVLFERFPNGCAFRAGAAISNSLSATKQGLKKTLVAVSQCE